MSSEHIIFFPATYLDRRQISPTKFSSFYLTFAGALIAPGTILFQIYFLQCFCRRINCAGKILVLITFYNVFAGALFAPRIFFSRYIQRKNSSLVKYLDCKKFHRAFCFDKCSLRAVIPSFPFLLAPLETSTISLIAFSHRHFLRFSFRFVDLSLRLLAIYLLHSFILSPFSLLFQNPKRKRRCGGEI